MRKVDKSLLRLVGLGTLSFAVLMGERTLAQTLPRGEGATVLPPVSVDAPGQARRATTVRPTTAGRRAATTRTQRATPTAAEPVRFLAPATSTLGAPPAAYAGGQVATGAQVGMLGNRTVMNTPFSQISYTNKTIQDQQARTVQDVLNNDPSVLASSPSGTPHDFQVIRGIGGFGTDGTRTLNGVAGMAPMF